MRRGVLTSRVAVTSLVGLWAPVPSQAQPMDESTFTADIAAWALVLCNEEDPSDHSHSMGARDLCGEKAVVDLMIRHISLRRDPARDQKT